MDQAGEFLDLSPDAVGRMPREILGTDNLLPFHREVAVQPDGSPHKRQRLEGQFNDAFHEVSKRNKEDFTPIQDDDDKPNLGRLLVNLSRFPHPYQPDSYPIFREESSSSSDSSGGVYRPSGPIDPPTPPPTPPPVDPDPDPFTAENYEWLTIVEHFTPGLGAPVIPPPIIPPGPIDGSLTYIGEDNPIGPGRFLSPPAPTFNPDGSFYHVAYDDRLVDGNFDSVYNRSNVNDPLLVELPAPTDIFNLWFMFKATWTEGSTRNYRAKTRVEFFDEDKNSILDATGILNGLLSLSTQAQASRPCSLYTARRLQHKVDPNIPIAKGIKWIHFGSVDDGLASFSGLALNIQLTPENSSPLPPITI